MKKIILVLLFSISFISSKSEIHTIMVWDGYMQFLPSITYLDLGDTIHFLPLDAPSMVHTITSGNIPALAASFDVVWQAPADTFFQYIPLYAGTYDYVCTPHIAMGMIGKFIVNNPASNCADSLHVSDVVINNSDLSIEFAIYNGYNSFLNYPHVIYTLDANNDTIQTGNMNLFGAINLDTTFYNYSISNPVSPSYPLEIFFVYGVNGSTGGDTCTLIYNSSLSNTSFINFQNNRRLLKIVDFLGKQVNTSSNKVLFYIYDDGTIEKKVFLD